jgi:hypothetical protein
MSTDFDENDFRKYKNDCSVFIETGSNIEYYKSSNENVFLISV